MAKNRMLDQPAELRKVAKMLAESADAMADARRAAMDADPPLITPGEFKLSILRENAMRDAVNTILLMAIDGAISGIAESQADLEQAIAAASEKLRKLENIKIAFSAFASLIGLAHAIVTGNPISILSALNELKNTSA